MRGIRLTALTMEYRRPPNLRPKTTRNQTYQTISSTSSRRSTTSPEPPSFQDTSTHLSDNPTIRNVSASANLEEVSSAHANLKNILKLQQVIGKGYKFPEFDKLFKSWLLSIKQFMWTYINPDSGLKGHWTAASLVKVNSLERRSAHVRKLHKWT